MFPSLYQNAMFSAQTRKSFTYLFPRNASPHFCSFITYHFFSRSAKKEGKLKDSVNSASVALFLKEIGLSDTQLEKVFKDKTLIHSANLEKAIKPNIKVFHDFGFSNTEIAMLISGQPRILRYDMSNKVIPSLNFLNDLLGSSHDHLFKVVKRFGWFLGRDIKKYVWPNIELLLTYGVPMEHILWLFRLNPRILVNSEETLRERLVKMETLGIDRRSKMYIHVFQVVGKLKNEGLEQKKQVLRDLGFTETEILEMFKKAPSVFHRAPVKLKAIIEMVLGTNKYSRASILSYPLVLISSIEKKIKPRLEVLEHLEKMDLIKKRPSLGAVYNYNSKTFHEKFVAPYSNQLEAAYALKNKSLITTGTA